MKTLLLDKHYKPIAFINYRRMARLVMLGKADVISQWNEPFYGKMNYPSIIVLKTYIRKYPLYSRFNFKGVFKRDLFTCQYTGVKLPQTQLTVDHVIPKSRGGKSTWENCVTAAKEINLTKGNRTPEEAGLKLLNKPVVPSDYLKLEYAVLSKIHHDWKEYFPGV